VKQVLVVGSEFVVKLPPLIAEFMLGKERIIVAVLWRRMIASCTCFVDKRRFISNRSPSSVTPSPLPVSGAATGLWYPVVRKGSVLHL